MLAVERAWREGGRWLLLAVLAGALQMLAGAPEVILLTWVLLAALFAGEMVQASASRWRMSARLVTVGLWVAGLAAAQLLPFLDLLTHSQRDKTFVSSMWSMPAWGWANFLVPLYRNYATPLGTYAQPDQYWIPSYYLGVGVISLALLAVGLVRRPFVWLLGVLTALCLLLTLGPHGLVYSALGRVLPGLGFMRYPIKFVILPTVLAPLLTATFLAHCSRVIAVDWPRLRRRIVGLGFALLAIIALLIWSAFRFPLQGASAGVAAQSGAIRAGFLILILGGTVAWRQVRRQPLERLARFALLLLLWLDVLTAGPRPNPSVPRWVYGPDLARKELHLDAAPQVGDSRAMLNAEAERNLLVAPMTNGVNQVLYARLAFYCNDNLLDHIPKVVGMYSLFLRESGDVLSTLFGAPQLPAGLADFLAVSHINTPNKVTEWEFRPNHLPWVTAGQKPVFADAAATLLALAAPDFDPRRNVFLPPEARAVVTVSNASPAKVSVQQFFPHKLQLEVQAPQAALVVIAQSFYHNWQAYVDDQPVRLLRANHAFQAIEVSAGRHQVTLVYTDRMFYCGGLVSLFSTAIWVAFWLRGRKQPSA